VAHRQHPRAGAIRIGLALQTISLVGASLVVGVLVDDLVGGTALGLAMSGLSLAFAALLMRDGALLPRARPIERWERAGLIATPAACVLATAATVVVMLITSAPPPLALVALMVSLGVGAGAFALFVMMRA
jgi:hypothetical protein